jgi:outer membrane biosynthesis protein TonB
MENQSDLNKRLDAMGKTLNDLQEGQRNLLKEMQDLTQNQKSLLKFLQNTKETKETQITVQKHQEITIQKPPDMIKEKKEPLPLKNEDNDYKTKLIELFARIKREMS